MLHICVKSLCHPGVWKDDYSDWTTTAGPVHSKLCPNGFASDAQLITMDVTVSEWCKLALFDMPHMYNCIKTAICIHYLS